MNNNHHHHGNSHPNHGQIKPDFFSDRQEEQLFRQIVAEENLEASYNSVCEATHIKLWSHFQSAAASLTVLYREQDARRQRDGEADSLWQPFQSAAGALTQLYRGALEGLRVGSEGARRSGYQRCRKDIAIWATSQRKKNIRLEELLTFLSTMDNNVNPSQPIPPPMPEPPQDMLAMEALAAADSALSQPVNVLSGTGLIHLPSAQTFAHNPSSRNLKRPLCATPPSAILFDRDVHMDTPQSKRPKSEL